MDDEDLRPIKLPNWRYDEITASVLEMFKKVDARMMPLPVFDIANRLGYSLVPYLAYGPYYNEVFMSVSKDGLTIQLNCSHRPIILYNDHQISTRVNFSMVLALKDQNKSRKLPEEAHSSKMYILNYPDGHFAQLRIYDRRHRLRLEIAYHPERTLDKSGKPVLHYHVYGQPGFKHGKAKRLSSSSRGYRKYLKFMKGVSAP